MLEFFKWLFGCKREGRKLDVHQFVTEVVKREAGKKQVDIAQAKEIFRVADDLLEGKLYRLIRRSYIKNV